MSDPANQHGTDVTELVVIRVPRTSADIKPSDHSLDGMQHSSGPPQHRIAKESVPVEVQGMTAETKATDCSSGSGGTAPRLQRLRRQSDTITAACANDADCMVITTAASQSAITERLRASREDIHPVDLLAVLTGATPMLQSAIADIESDSARGLMPASAAIDAASASTRRSPPPHARQQGQVGLDIFQSPSRCRENNEVLLEPAQSAEHDEGTPYLARKEAVEHPTGDEAGITDCAAHTKHEKPPTLSDAITSSSTDLQSNLINQHLTAPSTPAMALLSDLAEPHGTDGNGLVVIRVPRASADIKPFDHSLDRTQHSSGLQCGNWARQK